MAAGAADSLGAARACSVLSVSVWSRASYGQQCASGRVHRRSEVAHHMISLLICCVISCSLCEDITSLHFSHSC